MLGISTAYAADTAGAAAGAQQGGMSMIIMLVIFVAMIYFMIWRPQSKRAKQHRELVGGLGVGDEVVIGGGLAGKIASLGDHFIKVEIANGVEIKAQRSAIASVLPKGTLDAV